MASVTTATSEWIQFFKDAGIPPGLASNYAVSFVDNRIQKSMLMDLSKEIMIDLGITVIGDIIAILKHAKHVYRQDMCKMTSEAISSGQTSVQAELRRTANTPATRMIANALSRDSPPSTPAHRPDNRLSVTISNKGAKTAASQPVAENGLPVKRRRVTAEMEAKILKRTSVFERLGSESKADSSATNKVSGVFSRLDKVNDAEKKKTDNLVSDNDDSDGEGSVLQYAGVLKRPPLPPKKEPVVQKTKQFALHRQRNKVKIISSETPPSVPSSTSSTQEVAPKMRLLRRLGKAPSAPVSTSGLLASQSAEMQDSHVTSSKSKASSAVASSKVSSSTGSGRDSHVAQMDATTVSVFKRLGAKNI
ncbi:uncharacterized protein C19orf47 homolog isoform X3 [Trichomycterus rosablanca]|uniref:uncharacterized protein C19orf47 homolog isoform X3 n=1 Tax=Trichomycterus rosablanca TaxID=2290929 RepID=UPI002F350CB5